MNDKKDEPIKTLFGFPVIVVENEPTVESEIIIGDMSSYLIPKEELPKEE